MSHVVVRLGGERFALSMDAVAEVGRMPALTRVPGSPVWVAGVANWRGRILGVVDLRPLLGVTAERTAARGTGRLVVLHRSAVSVGVLAERVEGVLAIDEADLEAPLLTLTGDAESLLAGQLTDADGPVGVVDVTAALALRHRIGAARQAG